MSAQANIVAYDGAATPVVHTLVPVKNAVSNGITQADWRENITTLPVSANVRVSTTEQRLKNGITRVMTRTEVPVMESVSGVNAAGYTAAPKVAYVNTVDVVGYFSDRSTSAERKLARQLALNIAGNIITSVTPSTAGVVKELIDDLVSAS